MQQPGPVRVMIYYHASQAEIALAVQNAIGGISEGSVPVRIYMAEHTRSVPLDELDGLNAWIVLFTPQLEQENNLFNVIRRIEDLPKLERFLVFTEHDGGQKVTLPPIFHTLRAQQHHVYPSTASAAMNANSEDWQARLLDDLAECLPKLASPGGTGDYPARPDFMTRINETWARPRTTLMAVSLALFIILAWLAYTLIPGLSASLQPRRLWVGLAAQPPEMVPLWIDEGFTSINPGTWQETNLFRGTQSINVNTHANRLSLDAAPGIEHAIYRLESIRQWPLESLRGLQVSFIQLPPSQHGGSAELSFRVGLANDPAYYFGCSALPAGTDGTLRCSIREPERVLELNRPGNYSLDEWHKLIIQFVPQSYSVRFFLDGEFFGQSAIPTVEVWRGRDFKASLQMEATGLETGPASFQVDELLLARQE